MYSRPVAILAPYLYDKATNAKVTDYADKDYNEVPIDK